MNFNFGNLVSAAVGAVMAVANVREDGEFDEDDIEEILANVFKVLVGATMAMFGLGSSRTKSKSGEEMNKDKVKSTQDGFVISAKPLSEIMENAHIQNIGGNDTKLYDDWYLASIRDKNNKEIYTLIKIREPNDVQGSTGVTVPFVELNMKKISDILEKSSTSDLTEEQGRELYAEIFKVTNATTGSVTSDELVNYFSNPNSDGYYLIADSAVEKVLNETIEGNENCVWNLPNGYKSNDDYAKKELDELQNKNIYDKDRNSITIKDKNNLSKDEYNAILTATTGNADAYSFAGEVIYHADMQKTADQYQSGVKVDGWDWRKGSLGPAEKILNKAGNELEKHTISSDSGVGESMAGLLYEWKFKNKDSEIYKQQKELH